MEKIIEGGYVAVLVSPGYGAGWSSWNKGKGLDAESLLFDSTIVESLLNERPIEEIMEYVEKAYPTAYKGGVEELEVRWVAQGTKFLIEEYDGHESISTPQKPYTA